MLSEQNAVSSHVIPVCTLHLVFIPIFRLSIEQLMYVNNFTPAGSGGLFAGESCPTETDR